MSGVYIGTIRQSPVVPPSHITKKNAWMVGGMGKGTKYPKRDWLSEELLQAISIAQTVVKPKERYDFWIESATKLLAGSILYLSQRHGDLYYLDWELVRAFIEKLNDQETYLSDVTNSLDNSHPAYQIFKVLVLSAKQTREGTIQKLLEILKQHENQSENREYYGFQY
ncbi:hypothetical protein H9I32_16835 [Bacillus sp. Xin]|uniref:hypothetical protein n=1 Tax=unclassified Bacillus (in: firmicutes) TaxID=185979 RepID=UPI00157412D1|nr:MULTISPECIES: hypothetical protein [unclassified Bacillus (in: firmicutes)]MBC6973964.1 hypothetical protein [Bacillus sp. Xin]NSW38864.1 hypothetical protein [Bacillus sp. Xin1]